MLIVIVFLISCLSLWPLLQTPRQQASTALVEVQGRLFAKLHLAEPRRITVPGKNGQVVIEVENHRIRILDSSCPQKICVHSGAISRCGELLVCAPNRIVIRIPGDNGNSLDLITQ